MDSSGSIVEFFYNIVPGSLFLFSLKYFGIDAIKSLNFGSDPILIVFEYIVLGLFLGFLFQGITKIARDIWWNDEIANKVAQKRENKLLFEESSKNIYPNSRQIPEKSISIFYLMDSYLRGVDPAFLPTHFSSRFAFWSNIFFGSLASIIIVLGNYFLFYPHIPSEQIPGLVILLATSPVSKILADKHFDGFYDSILKSYFMLKVKNPEIVHK